MLGPGDEAFRRGERSASFWEENGDRSPLSVEPENRRENICENDIPTDLDIAIDLDTSIYMI